MDINSIKGANPLCNSASQKQKSYLGNLRYEKDTVELSSKAKKSPSFADKVIGFFKNEQSAQQTSSDIESNEQTKNISFKGSISGTSSDKPLGPIGIAKELFNSVYYKAEYGENYYPKAIGRDEFLDNLINLMPNDTTNPNRKYFGYAAGTFQNISKKTFGDSLIAHRAYVEYYNKILDDIKSLSDAMTRNADETEKDYMQRVCSKYIQNSQKEETVKNNKLASLDYNNYDDSIPSEEEIILTEQEKQELVDKLNKNRPGVNLSYDDDMKTIANEWRYSYMGAGTPLYDEKFANACLQEIRRYETKENQPTVRWMGIYDSNDLNNYIDSIPQEGETYSFPRFQSFSKNPVAAETQFRDDNPDKNIKVIVYPKRKTSQARDMGSGPKYGNNEVVYPKNSKFKVIHKGWEEGKSKNGYFPRYCVYLQEE